MPVHFSVVRRCKNSTFLILHMKEVITQSESDRIALEAFLKGKTPLTLELFHQLALAFMEAGAAGLRPAKTMISIATDRKRVAYITQLGKNFVHLIIPFTQAYEDNLCFQKIARVPGTDQYNHHFRMYAPEDLNAEIRAYIKKAVDAGQ
ncbi:MAG TPA: hypothetical protein VHK91_15260 [Flavisolibacter sp.]|jgi:hypothetical protein|nr:hypothetical protein [Flavisolibacter sp.]